MSFTYGFYNSLNHDRKYDARQMAAVFDGIINDGVFQSIGTAFVVQADTGLNVNVGVGRAWLNSTWSYNDSVMQIQAPPSDLLFDRIDALVIEINETTRTNEIKFVQGSAATNPINPTLTKSTYVNQYPLCYILRKANSIEIRQADITNRVGSTELPFVTGILKTISMDELLGQWEDELNRFVETEETDMNAWFQNKQIEYENWVALSQENYDTWIEENEAAFTAWFNHIQEILDENAVANLQTQIDANLLFSMGVTSEDVIFNSDGSITENLWLNNLAATGTPEWIKTTSFPDDNTINVTLVRQSDNYTVTKTFNLTDTQITGRATKSS